MSTDLGRRIASARTKKELENIGRSLEPPLELDRRERLESLREQLLGHVRLAGLMNRPAVVVQTQGMTREQAVAISGRIVDELREEAEYRWVDTRFMVLAREDVDEPLDQDSLHDRVEAVMGNYGFVPPWRWLKDTEIPAEA